MGLHFGGERTPQRNAIQVCNERRSRNAALCFEHKGLVGTKLGLDEDFTPVQQACKSKLWPLFKEAKATNKHAFWRATELFINGTWICSPSSI
jgi:hypothetical protein